MFWHQMLPTLLSTVYSGVRLRRDAYNKSLCKWGHFEKAKTTFKMLLATWFLVCFLKRFRSFVAENLKSVGQRAAKLPAIKLWEWFELAFHFFSLYRTHLRHFQQTPSWIFWGSTCPNHDWRCQYPLEGGFGTAKEAWYVNSWFIFKKKIHRIFITNSIHAILLKNSPTMK